MGEPSEAAYATAHKLLFALSFTCQPREGAAHGKRCRQAAKYLESYAGAAVEDARKVGAGVGMALAVKAADEVVTRAERIAEKANATSLQALDMVDRLKARLAEADENHERYLSRAVVAEARLAEVEAEREGNNAAYVQVNERLAASREEVAGLRGELEGAVGLLREVSLRCLCWLNVPKAPVPCWQCRRDAFLARHPGPTTSRMETVGSLPSQPDPGAGAAPESEDGAGCQACIDGVAHISCEPYFVAGTHSTEGEPTT